MLTIDLAPASTGPRPRAGDWVTVAGQHGRWQVTPTDDDQQGEIVALRLDPGAHNPGGVYHQITLTVPVSAITACTPEPAARTLAQTQAVQLGVPVVADGVRMYPAYATDGTGKRVGAVWRFGNHWYAHRRNHVSSHCGRPSKAAAMESVGWLATVAAVALTEPDAPTLIVLLDGHEVAIHRARRDENTNTVELEIVIRQRVDLLGARPINGTVHPILTAQRLDYDEPELYLLTVPAHQLVALSPSCDECDAEPGRPHQHPNCPNDWTN